MTRWAVPTDGRPRGPIGLARSWIRVMAAPREFFDTAISPGDQAAGLVFAMGVTGIATMSWLATVAKAPPVPVTPDPLGYAVTVLAVVAVITPVGLHIGAALQTGLLVLAVPADQRAGVDETVQVLSYAVAPCLFAGTPSAWLTVVATAYGTLLFVIGITHRHQLSPGLGLAVALPIAGLVFGWAFRGFAAAERLWTQYSPVFPPGLF